MAWKSLFLTLSLVTGLAIVSTASAATPVPVTPASSIPAAPTYLSFSSPEALVWTDNSDNEDGFRIVVEIGGRELQYQVGPNVTNFDLPSEAQVNCPSVSTASFSVSAFNSAGASAPAGTNISALCAVPELLKAIVNTLFTSNASQIQSLLEFTMVPCTEHPKGKGQPPECRQGEAEGAPVDVFLVATCEGAYVRPDALQDVVSFLSNPGPQVVGIYEYQSTLAPGQSPFFRGDYVIVMSRGPQNAGGIWIEQGRITGVHMGCGQTPDQFMAFWNLVNRIDLTAAPTATPRSALPSTGTGGHAATESWYAAFALFGLVLICVALAARRWRSAAE